MTTHEERKNEARAASVGTSFWQQLWLIAVSGRWLYPLLGVFGLMLVSAVTEPTYRTSRVAALARARSICCQRE